MNLLLLKPRTKQSISMKELLDCLKQSKEKNVIVSLSQDHKILIIEMKV